ncbi:MAG: O-antigen ligase family protein [Lachnospiraceae bacterium]|nr:O-antigen ligase family protein [Lachnospiraceae bacterium]
MKGKKSETPEMWDLLIPVLLVIGVLPLIVHLAVYSCGYSQYEWYLSNDILADFYCYYKSYFLDVIAFFACVILAFRFALYREQMKPVKYAAPLFGYCAFVLLSTLCSVNRKASVQGNFESFESCFVLISYVVLFLYTYQLMQKERDYRIIWRGILWLCTAFVLIGAFQVSGHDLLDFMWVQRLVMSEENFAAYGGEIENLFTGNNVYLTLYNPNYAGIALSMLFAIVFFVAVTEQEKKRRRCYAALCALLACLVWFTYSRASLLTMIMTLILTLLWTHRLRVKGDGNGGAANNRLIAAGAGILLIVLVGTDAILGFPYLSRILEKNDREPLEEMVTDEEGIHIRYARTDYLLYVEGETLSCRSEQSGDTVSAPEGESLKLPFEASAEAVLDLQDGQQIYVFLLDTTLSFVREDGIYYYQNAAGKRSRMTPVPAADLHGLEYLGSARGYIWSRVLPLLKRYLVLGSGPDTFAEVFPQNDYAGKIVYADDPDRVIEKAHNDYLTKWVQTGFLSVVCVAAFYVLLIAKCRRQYRSACREAGTDGRVLSLQLRLGIGCYLACISFIAASFFNDSTVQTAPLFWVFAGIALSGAAEPDK